MPNTSYRSLWKLGEFIQVYANDWEGYRCDLPEYLLKKEWSCPVANDLKAVNDLQKTQGQRWCTCPNPPPNPRASRKKWQNTLRGMQANRTATVKSGSSVKNPCAPRETALTGKILMDIGTVTAMEDTPKYLCSIRNTILKGPILQCSVGFLDDRHFLLSDSKMNRQVVI